MVPFSLIEKLYLSGAIVVGKKILRHDGKETFFDMRLRNPIYDEPEIRSEIVELFHTALEKRYAPLRSEEGVHRCGIICVSWTLAPVIAGIKCPMVTLAPFTTPEGTIMQMFGHPRVGCRYFVADDTIMTGRTISNVLQESAYQGYKPDGIIVFCDRQEGGREYIKERMRVISKETGVPLKFDITCLTTRQKILESLKRGGHLSLSDYRRGTMGSTVADAA